MGGFLTDRCTQDAPVVLLQFIQPSYCLYIHEGALLLLRKGPLAHSGCHPSKGLPTGEPDSLGWLPGLYSWGFLGPWLRGASPVRPGVPSLECRESAAHLASFPGQESVHPGRVQPVCCCLVLRVQGGPHLWGSFSCPLWGFAPRYGAMLAPKRWFPEGGGC